MSAAQRLMVMVPDRITDILVKGEYQPNYYNPGELFDDVHLLTTTDDRPDLTLLQRTVGRARLPSTTSPSSPPSSSRTGAGGGAIRSARGPSRPSRWPVRSGRS